MPTVKESWQFPEGQLTSVRGGGRRNRKEESVNFYELMVILSPNLTEEEWKQQVHQIEELLKHEKATIHLVDHWGKRKLAYPVRKQRQGFYEWFYFETEPGRITEVDRKLKMAEQVLRFMTLRMEKVQVQNLHKEVARRKEAPPAVQRDSATSEAASLQGELAPEAEEDVETTLDSNRESSREAQEE